MRAVLLLLLACAPSGCDIVFHIDPITAGSNQVFDAQPPTAEGIDPVCSLVGNYGRGNAGLISYCVHSDRPPLDLGGMFNTTANPMCDYVASEGADMASVCVVDAKTIAVTTKLTVRGDKPLVLAALDTITVAAEIDLTAGPDANPPACEAGGNGNTGASNSSGTAGGGGGGGGGSWQTHGGKGGLGKTGTAAVGGSIALAVVEIRGGCAGGAGGSGIGGAGAMGGDGGGAIYLTARTAIHLTSNAVINASGRGGPGGNAPDGGAGGGGSGGLIALDSPVVSFDLVSQPGSKLLANGGGGGAGGNAVAGGISTDPAVSGTGASPNGGAGAIGQGNGAAGIAGTTTGGGGGGGGQGFIVVYTQGPMTVDPNHISPNMTSGM